MSYVNGAIKNESTTKALIKTRFLDEYRNKALRQIRIDDLAKACSISRGTFYFYYESIPFLYNECEQVLIDLMEFYVPELSLCTVGNDIDSYIKTSVSLLQDIENHMEEFKCLLTGSEMDSFKNAWTESIYKAFLPTVGFLRNTKQPTRENISRFYAGGLMTIQKNWILTDCSEPVEEFAATMARVVFQGLYTLQDSEGTS